MSNKKVIDYQIIIDGYESIKGTVKVNVKESLISIREKIQKLENMGDNTIYIQQPNGEKINQSTKYILLRQIRQKQRLRKQSLQGSSIVFDQQSLIQKPTSQEYMYRQPEMPPRVIGRVKRCYKFFSCMSSNRTMILNFQAVRFSYNQTDTQPERIINLKDIKQISSYRKQNYFFLRIITNQGQQIDFKFLNKQVCKQWIIYFNKALQYSDYLCEKKNYSKIDSYQNFMKSLQQKDKDTKIIKLQDSTFAEEQQDKSIKCQSDNTFIKNSSKIIRLADFKVSHQIGKGAFSTVYKAQRQGKIYALKQTNKDKLIYQNQLKYAITQLNILKKCNNKCPFIVPLYYAFQTQDYLYLTIKYLPFGTLKSLVEKRKQLTVRQSFSVICQLISAIQFLHLNKVLYRDMKPQNIMITQQGHIYLIDFGLSIELDQQQQFAQSFVGTPLYLAPQRLEGSGKINFKADIYGVGCIYYFMLHGHAPFQADSLASIIFNIKNCDLKIRDDIDDMSKDFLKKTLQIDANKRLNHMSSHPLFEKVEWNKISKKQSQFMSAQLKQSIQYCGSTGTGDKDYTEENYPNKKVNDWNYVHPMQGSGKN